MELINEVNYICPHCGYSLRSPQSPTYLTLGTILNERYTVGKLLRFNGEGADYIAYDDVSESKVVIREFIPDSICSRVRGSANLVVNSGMLVQYKTFLQEFIELHKSLAKMRTLSHICAVHDLFAENNTAYAVTEHFDGVTLREFLSEYSGELTWEQVKKLFPPIFTTLSLVHNAGIIHRGISPETIYVTERGDLKLTGFNTIASRTANAEIAGELFAGYTAPEQYSASEWHGTWTDVYGISAVLYRVLAGCMPTEAISRVGRDNLLEPAQVNPSIPANVSKVIMSGLKLATDSRIQTITELVTKLFEQPSYMSGAATSSMDPVNTQQAPANRRASQQQQATRKAAEEKRRQRNGQIVAAVLGTVAVLVVISAIVYLFMVYEPENNEGHTTSSVSKPTATYATPITTPKVESEDLFVVPTLTGHLHDEFSEGSFGGAFILVPEYDYSEGYDKGIIFEQSLEANETVPFGTEIKIKISKGSKFVKIPDFTGKNKNEYLAELDTLFIKYETKNVESEETIGTVVGVSKSVGSIVDTSMGEIIEVSVAITPTPIATDSTD